MHIVQRPTLGIPAEIEMDFLSRTEVKEFSNDSFSILACIRTGDGELFNRPVLSVEPEGKSKQPISLLAQAWTGRWAERVESALEWGRALRSQFFPEITFTPASRAVSG